MVASISRSLLTPTLTRETAPLDPPAEQVVATRDPVRTLASPRGEVATQAQSGVGQRSRVGDLALRGAQLRTRIDAGSAVVAAQPRSSEAQVMGLSMYRQNDGEWAKEPYRYDQVLGLSRSTNKLGKIGCSITSLTNILNWSVSGRGSGTITPSDTNNQRNNYASAMRQTGWRDLSGQGKDLLRPLEPIAQDSAAGRALEDNIRSSIRAGRPVLVGIAKEDSSWRHSMVAAGVDAQGRVLVVDPWQNDGSGRASYWTLDAAMKHYRATRFDMAMEARRTSLR